MNRINEARGKRGERLLELQEAVVDVGRREREVQAERGEAERRVAELEEARRQALMAEELAAAGEVPEGEHDLAKTERALAKARSELAEDPWSARLEALGRLRAQGVGRGAVRGRAPRRARR